MSVSRVHFFLITEKKGMNYPHFAFTQILLTHNGITHLSATLTHTTHFPPAWASSLFDCSRLWRWSHLSQYISSQVLNQCLLVLCANGPSSRKSFVFSLHRAESQGMWVIKTPLEECEPALRLNLPSLVLLQLDPRKIFPASQRRCLCSQYLVFCHFSAKPNHDSFLQRKSRGEFAQSQCALVGKSLVHWVLE